MIEKVIQFNQQLVENKGYEPYITSKYPDKKLAILTCMDTRLTELLPAALGIKNGDAKIIKNAGCCQSYVWQCYAESSDCYFRIGSRRGHGDWAY